MSLEDKYKALINPKAFIDATKEDFKKQYKGKIPFDLDTVWNWIKANRGSKPRVKHETK